MKFDENVNRRKFLKISGMAAGGMMLPGLLDQAFGKEKKFPYKQMEALEGFPPGGGLDRGIRILAPAWEKYLGTDKPFKMSYLPGAGGLIALRKLVRDPRPDGHRLNFLPIQYTAWIFELKKADFPMSALTHVGSYFTDPDVLLVKKDAKWDRIDQFIDDARNAKKPLTVAVSSPFSGTHAATVVLRELSGANLKVISFRGGSKSRNAVAGGHTDACMAPYWSAMHVFELTKAIGIFQDHNPAPDLWKPVPVNDVLDFKMPDLIEPYTVQVNTKVKEKYPERYQKLVSSLKETVESKEFKQAAEKQKLTAFIKYMTPEEVDQSIVDYLKMLGKFKPAMEKDVKDMM